MDLPAGTQTFTLRAEDASGNVTEQDYEIEVDAAPARTYTHDLNGNLLDDGERQYDWDAENRLIRITDGDKVVEFAYDGMSRRMSLIETDNAIEVRNHRYLWDGVQILQERSSTGGAWRKRYYSQGVQVRDGSSSDNYYYTRDHLGSIREVVEADGETVVARYDYDPYGRVETLGTSTFDADFRYTGHFYFNFAGAPEERGLHFAPYRVYTPEHGRWLSRDPLEDAELLPEGPGLYGYVGNDPVNYWDPLGLRSPMSPGLQVMVGELDLPGGALERAGRIIEAGDRMAGELLNRHQRPSGLRRSFDFCKRNTRSLKVIVKNFGSNLRPKPPSPVEELLGVRGQEAHRAVFELENQGIAEWRRYLANPDCPDARRAYDEATRNR